MVFQKLLKITIVASRGYRSNANVTSIRFAKTFVPKIDTTNDQTTISAEPRQTLYDRMNAIFNTVCAEIDTKNSGLESGQKQRILAGRTNLRTRGKPITTNTTTTTTISDRTKDRILRELIAAQDASQVYEIHDMIEQEFQLEISDHEFRQFRSLNDVVNYVERRLEIRRSIPMIDDDTHPNTVIYY